ncbi:diphthine--ammonia ligase [Cuniculiplasma sp. SKW3]|uniref:diphthine--ammonia ligase n=1 Tax=Cuniculiplasma sp. SKW3 TaxID=3400170 RepID=UPI003FD1A436
MRAISLLSGGKDSFLSTLFAMDQGHDVVLSVSVRPEEYSEMFHYPNTWIVPKISALLNIPNVTIPESEFYIQIPKIAKENNCKMIISGAIASNFQKTRIEKMCTENNLVSYTPLWLVDQTREVKEVIRSRIRALLCSVSAEGLTEDMLGSALDDDMIRRLASLSERYSINISGEGGEYESLVMGWFNRSIDIKGSRKIWKGSSGYFLFDE